MNPAVSGAAPHRVLPPVVHIEPGAPPLRADLAELWRARDLLVFLVWRDLKLRHQQTVLGMAWIALRPILTTLIFTLFFGKLAGLTSDGLPYASFGLCGVLMWNYFVHAMQNAGLSVAYHGNLIGKVYFPRLILPISQTVGGLIDLGAGLLLLVPLALFQGVLLGAGLGPALAGFVGALGLTWATALGLGAAFSVLNARMRDLQYTLPYLLQMGFFASPVVYGLSLVPESWRMFYGLNPMAGAVGLARWGLLGGAWPGWDVLLPSVSVALLTLGGGLALFRREQRKLADLV